MTKLFTFEKISFLLILIGSAIGFWYFEESLGLKIIALALSLFSVFLAIRKKKPQSLSKFELASLLILYLGTFSLYNLLFSINLPLYIIMTIVLILVCGLVFSILTLDGIYNIVSRETANAFIILLGLVILEVFLTLYFWPIDPETKSIIIVVFFYLIVNLIYLYANSMLRFKKAVGYVLVSLLILSLALAFSWWRLVR